MKIFLLSNSVNLSNEQNGLSDELLQIHNEPKNDKAQKHSIPSIYGALMK